MNGPGFGSFSGPNKRPRKNLSKRPAPLSLRLTVEERELLEELSMGMSMSAFIKQRLFNEDTNTPLKPRRKRKPRIKDYEALAQLLALLGSSRLSQNMNQLAKAAHVGNLPLQPDVERQLISACGDIHAMRVMLMRALGMRIRSEDEIKAESVSQTFSRAAAGFTHLV